VVVVASILIALALEALWGQGVERRQAAEIVRSLEAEFSSNRETLLSDLERVETYVTSTRRVLDAVTPKPGESIAVESLGADLWETLSWRTSNLTTSTLDAVISSGNLETIEPESLRIALAGWPAILDDMAEEEAYEWREITERYHPYLGSFLPIPSLETEAPVNPPSEERLRSLLSDGGFQSRLSWRLDVSIVSLEAKHKTLAELDRILRLLRGAL